MEFVPTSDNDGTMTKGNTRWNEEGEIFSTTATKKKREHYFSYYFITRFSFSLAKQSGRLDQNL